MHPEVAGRSCGDCKTYLYADTPGRMGLPVIRGGVRVERLPQQGTPCHQCPKIPMGAPQVPASAVELSDRNRRAYLHYRQCKAITRFPFDAIVERNAGIISIVEDSAKNTEAGLGHLQLLATIAALAGRN